MPGDTIGMERRFDAEFTGTPTEVRRILIAIMTDLARLRLDPEESGTVELVLAEALNNVVEHAYGPDKQGKVRLSVSHAPGGLRVCIRDNGVTMPDGAVPLSNLADGRRSKIDTPEGGFGWFIIRDLARDIRYRREGSENCLDFRIAVGLGFH